MTLSGRLHSAPCAVRTANALDLHNFRCFSSPPVSVNSSFFLFGSDIILPERPCEWSEVLLVCSGG